MMTKIIIMRVWIMMITMKKGRQKKGKKNDEEKTARNDEGKKERKNDEEKR